jgi:hypothetical protein
MYLSREANGDAKWFVENISFFELWYDFADALIVTTVVFVTRYDKKFFNHLPACSLLLGGSF